jgi:biopolymer transport protein ExbB/TolQ
VVGILGQFQGIYEALNAIAAAAEVSPQVVWRGLAVSFTTTLAGLATLVVAALVWVSLQAVLRRSARLSSNAA